jgi:light-regulated signal transduction histidine kinase (bacteriophytochrome)
MTPFGAVGYEDGAFRNSVGLALCREIARLHGGSLRIVAAPGVPAVLTLELPA